MTTFLELIASQCPSALRADGLGALMLNVGKRCDLACVHCYHDAGPARTEMMSDRVCDRALALALAARPQVVDFTGGAPELHPRLAEMVVTLSEAGLAVRVRTNLVSLLTPTSAGLPELFAENHVELLGSFPSADRPVFEAQRGSGSFELALEALRMLNRLGYGRGAAEHVERPLRLTLVVNPSGTERAPSADDAAAGLRSDLAPLGVAFDDVLVLANVPVGRFARMLESDGSMQPYIDELRGRFNPDVVPLLGCRCGITVSWDGSFADCDFNLGAGLSCDDGEPQSVFDVDFDEAGLASIATRRIRYGIHCLACTADAGSS